MNSGLFFLPPRSIIKGFRKNTNPLSSPAIGTLYLLSLYLLSLISYPYFLSCKFLPTFNYEENF